MKLHISARVDSCSYRRVKTGSDINNNTRLITEYEIRFHDDVLVVHNLP